MMMMNRARNTVLILGALSQVLTGCGVSKAKVSFNGLNDAPVSTGPGTVGLKTAANLPAAIEAVTGLSIANEPALMDLSPGGMTLQRQIELSRNFLPKEGGVSELSSTPQLVFTSIGLHAARIVARKERSMAAGSRVFYGSIDFTQAPSVALAPDKISKVLDVVGPRVLQRKLTAEEVLASKSCVNEQIAEEGTVASANSGRELANERVVTLCTLGMHLSSMAFLKD